MNMENMKHNDCSNFCPIDVAKGICRLTNETIFIDSKVCNSYTEMHKCKNCSKFINPNSDGLGTCVGFKKEAWTPGELKAVLCEMYKSK